MIFSVKKKRDDDKNVEIKNKKNDVVVASIISFFLIFSKTKKMSKNDFDSKANRKNEID